MSVRVRVRVRAFWVDGVVARADASLGYGLGLGEGLGCGSGCGSGCELGLRASG